MIIEEWLVFPVVVNVEGSEAYAVFGDVPYLQVDASFVVSERVVCVVVCGRVSPGVPPERTGGVESWVTVMVTSSVEVRVPSVAVRRRT